MTSLRALREKTQKGKIEGRERPWLYASLQRGPSIYITWLLVKTPISPNTVSLLSILVGLLGAFLLLVPHIGFFFLGLFFLYLNILLDKVDGEIARYRNTHSLRGVFLDEINHLIVPAIFFIAVMLHVLLYTPITALFALLIILSGCGAALAMSFIRTGWSLAPQIFAKKYIKRQEEFPLPEHREETHVETLKKNFKGITWLLKLIHQFQEFFMILLVFFIGALIQTIYMHPILPYILIGYGILLPLIFIENTIKGFWAVEHRVRTFRDRFLS